MDITEIRKKYRFSYRDKTFATFDFAASFIGMFIIAYFSHSYLYSKSKYITGDKNRFIMGVMLLALPLGILTHVVSGTDTPFNQMILGKGYLLEKIALAAMTFYGVKLIKA